MTLKVLDLFSGIGGFSLGLERTGGFETVAFCEIEEYPRRVLAKHWPDVPCHKDVKELTADAVGHIDLICGGYPCQPFSQAGQRRGAEDDRHLWPEVKRLVASIRPRWCLFENVAGHISMGLDEVLSDLESEGYTAWTVVIPACAVDAPHRRDRVWIMAHTESIGHGQGGGERNIHKTDGGQVGERGPIIASTGEQPQDTSKVAANPKGAGAGENKRGVRGLSERCCEWTEGMGQEDVAHANGDRTQRGAEQGCNGGDGTKPGNQQPERLRGIPGGRNRGKAEWLPEPCVGRVAHGVPRRVDRLRCLGNAVVPQIPEMIGYAILEAERND